MVVTRCTKCDIAFLCGKKVTTRGPLNAKVLFVGHAPYAEDHITRKPLSGENGEELTLLVDESFPKDTPYMVTNAVLCTPFVDDYLDEVRKPSLSEVEGCRKHLDSLIEIIKPKLIVALGKEAARPLKKSGHTFVEISAPAAILASSHVDLEHNRAVLKLRQAAKDISL
jgi:uracil-DNA glycosylase